MADDSKLFAALAHGLGLLVFFIPALVIWLVKKDDDAFVGEHARQAMNFQITIFIAAVVSGLLAIVVIGLLLLPVVYIIFWVFSILAIIKAAAGEEYDYPKWTSIPIFK